METSLLNMTKDILWRMENQEITTMFILNLSAVFDTVDHDILLAIMEQTFGFKEKTLKWFDKYLKQRYFKVCINVKSLESKNLTFSMPQGSCSGANLLSCYCSLITTAIPNSLNMNDLQMTTQVGLSTKHQTQQKLRKERKTGKHT